MPWAILDHSITFVDMDFTGSSVSRTINHSILYNFELHFQNISIHSIQKQLESQTNIRDLLKRRRLATIEQGFVIVETYKLKEKLSFDKRDMQLLFQMKQAVHDNINPFIGVCVNRTHELYVIWRHCFRGTLADLLFSSPKNKNGSTNTMYENRTSAVVDNNFKGAFVRDIIKVCVGPRKKIRTFFVFQGLDFIHNSSIGYHGGLTASQCLVDSHWIVKISGFGISRLLFKWRHNGMMSYGGRIPLIPNSGKLLSEFNELLFVSRTVLLRARSPQSHQRRNSTQQAGIVGFYVAGRTRSGHVNSFKKKSLFKISQNLVLALCFIFIFNSTNKFLGRFRYSFGAILYEILYLKRIAEISDSREDSLTNLENIDDDVGIFNPLAEELVPIYPIFPDDEVHPDLISLMHKCFNGKMELRPDTNMIRKITDATLKM